MWEINNYNQLITFFLSCCLGAICCTVYDIVRALRKVGFNSFWAITVGDILLWILYAFITFIFLIARTNGEMRGYVILGEFIGFVLFHISLSKLLFPLFSFVFEKVTAANRIICKSLYSVYMRIESFVLKMFMCIVKIFKSVKKVLKNALGLLYTNKNITNMEKTLNETTTEA